MKTLLKIFFSPIHGFEYSIDKVIVYAGYEKKQKKLFMGKMW